MNKLLILLLLSGCCDKIGAINSTANQAPYIRGVYDCRMFAEAKYKALIANGYKDEEIRFVVTQYKNQPHVVLRVDGRILDNNYEDPYPATKALQGGLTFKTWNYYRKLS